MSLGLRSKLWSTCFFSITPVHHYEGNDEGDELVCEDEEILLFDAINNLLVNCLINVVFFPPHLFHQFLP